MKIAIVMDSFKGCLSSVEAGEAAAKGIKRVSRQDEVHVLPLADGGEGTVQALVEGLYGSYHICNVSDPLGRTIACTYGILPDRRTAVLEMAAAAGLPLLSVKERNPLYTTSYGVGQVIRKAFQKGCDRFIIGIGGSATNDGGVGMLSALGALFLDSSGNLIPQGAVGLRDLARIDLGGIDPRLRRCEFRIACDVTNPLCGPNGCSKVFGSQKGASPEDIARMDTWMERYGRLALRLNPNAGMDSPGAGAAGGMGFAFETFLGGKLLSGVDLILEETGAERVIRGVDYVFTGEGRMDAQTAMGKAPAGVAALAKKFHKPVIALVGSVGSGIEACHRAGIDAVFSLMNRMEDIPRIMEKPVAAENLADTAEQIRRLLGSVVSVSYRRR